MQCLHTGCQRGMMNILWHLNTDLNRALNRRALSRGLGTGARNACPFMLVSHWALQMDVKPYLAGKSALPSAGGWTKLTQILTATFISLWLFSDKKLLCDYFGVLWLFKEQLKCYGQILQQNI